MRAKKSWVKTFRRDPAPIVRGKGFTRLSGGCHGNQPSGPQAAHWAVPRDGQENTSSGSRYSAAFTHYLSVICSRRRMDPMLLVVENWELFYHHGGVPHDGGQWTVLVTRPPLFRSSLLVSKCFLLVMLQLLWEWPQLYNCHVISQQFRATKCNRVNS